MKKLLPIVALALLLIGGIFAYRSNGADQTAQALQVIAEEAPNDAMGFAAVNGPGALLTELGERLDDNVRSHLLEEIGIDAFDPAAYLEAGLNLSASAGIVLIGADPPSMAITFGTVGSPEEARDSMLAKLTELDAEDALVATTIGEAPALLIADELAVVFDAERVAFVFANLDWRIDDKVAALTEIATAFLNKEGEAFADAEDLAAATNFDGQPMAAGVLNPETLRELNPDLGALPGWDEIVAVGLAADSTDERIRFQARGVVNAESQYFTPFEDAPAFGDATSQIPGPLEVGFRLRFDPAATFALLQSELPEFEEGYTEMRDGANEAAGLDVEEDVIGNLTGELGIFLQTIPNEQSIVESRAVAFIGVNDTAAAAEMIATLAEETGGMAQSRDVDGTTMYFVPVGPVVAFAAYDGYLWIAANDAALEAILLGDSNSFADDDGSEAAGDLFDNPHVAAMFINFAGQLSEMIIEQLDETAAPGTEDLLASLKNLVLEVGRDGDVLTINALLYWDGDAAGDALAGAFSTGFLRGFRQEEDVAPIETEGNSPPSAAPPTGAVNTIAPPIDGGKLTRQ